MKRSHRFKLIQILFLAFGLSVAHLAHAETPRLDLGLTPAERFQRGLQETGIQNGYDPQFCSILAAARLVRKMPNNGRPINVVPGNSKFAMDSKTAYSARQLTEGYRQVLSRILTPFIASGDPYAAQHRTCLVLIDGAKNIISDPNGFIFIDPTMLDIHLKNFPAHQDSSLGLALVLTHEFSHQLQFWFADIFNSASSLKWTELVADCTGAALVHNSYAEQMPLLLQGISLENMATFAGLFGDNEISDRTHHGTPEERSMAVRGGVEFMTTWHKNHPDGQGLTLRRVLSYCGMMTYAVY